MRIAGTAVLLIGWATATGAWAAEHTPRSTEPSIDDMISNLRPKSDLQLQQAPTGGIRIGAAQPTFVPPTHMAHSVSVAPSPAGSITQSPSEQGLLSLSIPFASGSSTLLPDATPILQKLGAALNSPELAGYRFRVEGHTDSVGSTLYNRELSAERARTVAEYLEQNFGISPARLDTAGFGFDRPAVPTPAQTPEPRNRRVQIVNLGA